MDQALKTARRNSGLFIFFFFAYGGYLLAAYCRNQDIPFPFSLEALPFLLAAGLSISASIVFLFIFFVALPGIIDPSINKNSNPWNAALNLHSIGSLKSGRTRYNFAFILPAVTAPSAVTLTLFESNSFPVFLASACTLLWPTLLFCVIIFCAWKNGTRLRKKIDWLMVCAIYGLWLFLIQCMVLLLLSALNIDLHLGITILFFSSIFGLWMHDKLVGPGRILPGNEMRNIFTVVVILIFFLPICIPTLSANLFGASLWFLNSGGGVPVKLGIIDAKSLSPEIIEKADDTERYTTKIVYLGLEIGGTLWLRSENGGENIRTWHVVNSENIYSRTYFNGKLIK